MYYGRVFSSIFCMCLIWLKTSSVKSLYRTLYRQYCTESTKIHADIPPGGPHCRRIDDLDWAWTCWMVGNWVKKAHFCTFLAEPKWIRTKLMSNFDVVLILTCISEFILNFKMNLNYICDTTIFLNSSNFHIFNSEIHVYIEILKFCFFQFTQFNH